ncbi:MAG: mechanosensitive ion channel family protein [Sphaerochaetaceae bacterium]|nr:mechanosensitive ion channel family protein [Sphaerochaetaceae bacterium]
MVKGLSLVDSIKVWMNEELFSVILNVLVILLILVIGELLISVFRKVLTRAFARSRKLSELFQRLLVKVLVGLAQLVLGMIILERLGVNLAPIIAGLGVTGFILGFAFQETIGNFLAGAMIAINAPFRIGDYIEVGGMNGTVRDMDFMSVTLATPDNKRVVMANKLIWGHAIVNYSYTERRRVEMGVSIAYDADVNKAKELIRGIISSYPEVLPEPAPVVEVNVLGGSSVDIVVRPWTVPGDYWSVYFRFQQEVLETFRREGIEIPFPQLDVHNR